MCAICNVIRHHLSLLRSLIGCVTGGFASSLRPPDRFDDLHFGSSWELLGSDPGIIKRYGMVPTVVGALFVSWLLLATLANGQGVSLPGVTSDVVATAACDARLLQQFQYSCLAHRLEKGGRPQLYTYRHHLRL
ncbi:hypothetical protein TSOC_009595 [Tetrabaena socialis]|uniref:Uncharacterized protein n=1 Tax=Tetrabaena socialis TaxID=47790 RepID=A0A2J7ZVF6_9CHLO|nr:hypothetical protein TSOC_009595 [Tetrabaena socialis]|eukprot:PNH04267.1 hypothetical protein TSOC_009595 [Tetrabaena socialis]